MALNRPPTLNLGTQVLERYTVMAVVGQGGLGTVYQVRDDKFSQGNIYALKETFDLSQGARDQFLREAQWLERLDHRNIPRVRHYFQWGDRLYVVMDFISGENLEQKLLKSTQRHLSESEVLRWIIPIADAIAYLHSQQPPIIHRDVKPANIIVTPTGYPALVDLGIAKEHLPGAGATATFIRKAGTEGYAPPEQYTAKGATGPWSDIYSLGATMYHLLTGQVPASAVERAALDGQLMPLRAMNPTLSVPLERVVLKAMNIRPSDRFASMRDMRQELENCAQSANTYHIATPRSGPVTRGPVSAPHMSAPHMSGPNMNMPKPNAMPTPPTGLTPAQNPPSVPYRPPRRGIGGRAIERPRNHEKKGQASTESARSNPASIVTTDPRRSGENTAASSDSKPRLSISWRVIVPIIVVTAVALVALVSFLISQYGPPDQSTAQASATGYFSAIKDHNYQRAYGYFSTNASATLTYNQFVSAQGGDVSTLGDIENFRVTSVSSLSVASAQVVVSVNRKNAGSPVIYTLTVTQSNGTWLIDNVTSG